MKENLIRTKEITSIVDGFLPDSEGELLYVLAESCPAEKAIVEIGSFKGKSTIWLARGSQRGKEAIVYAIDPHTGSPEHKEMFGHVWTYEDFLKNIRLAGVESLVRPIIKTSQEAALDFQEEIGLLFVDGDHSYEMVSQDIRLWFPKVAEGGVIAFHDSTSPIFEVRKAVYKFIKSYAKNLKDIHFEGSILYGIKANNNSWRDRLGNNYVLALHRFYSFAITLNPPLVIAVIGRWLAHLAQRIWFFVP